MATPINIEVVYATPTKQSIVNLILQEGNTIKDAIIASKLYTEPFDNLAVGIFGKQRSLDHVLENGDRVEIYSPLFIDPKLARQKRVQKERKQKGTKK